MSASSKLSSEDVPGRLFEYLAQTLEKPPTRPLSASTRLAADLYLDSQERAQLLSPKEDQLDRTIPVSALRRVETLGDVANVAVSAFNASRSSLSRIVIRRSGQEDLRQPFCRLGSNLEIGPRSMSQTRRSLSVRGLATFVPKESHSPRRSCSPTSMVLAWRWEYDESTGVSWLPRYRPGIDWVFLLFRFSSRWPTCCSCPNLRCSTTFPSWNSPWTRERSSMQIQSRTEWRQYDVGTGSWFFTEAVTPLD